LKDPEYPDLDAVALNQAVPHGDEETVYHFGGQVLLAPGALADQEGQILLRYGGQEHLLGRLPTALRITGKI
jgi:hypothetical protein